MGHGATFAWTVQFRLCSSWQFPKGGGSSLNKFGIWLIKSQGPVAQWIRHRPTEPGIAGSSPAGVIVECYVLTYKWHVRAQAHTNKRCGICCIMLFYFDDLILLYIIIYYPILLGIIWQCLVLFGIIWYYSELFGIVWYYSV